MEWWCGWGPGVRVVRSPPILGVVRERLKGMDLGNGESDRLMKTLSPCCGLWQDLLG
ncbi:MAG TPA: hypothetical protein PLM24_04405 [Methanothrix sp.]|nr:hypothetical protein [Methanothrix sp.]HPJ84778.1 hypothetical protein [Methanothrix sp.]HPR66359.1 hypothetical protein [Methanothrix sp.]